MRVSDAPSALRKFTAQTTTLAAAFNLFKKPGKETLSEAEALPSASAAVAVAGLPLHLLPTLLRYAPCWSTSAFRRLVAWQGDRRRKNQQNLIDRRMTMWKSFSKQ